MNVRLLAVLLCMTVSTWSAETDQSTLRFATAFTDNMVLQRDKPATINGRATASAQVTVTLG